MDQCPSLPSVMWPLCLGPKLPFIGSSILYFIISNAGLHRFLKTYLKCSFWGTHVCIKNFFYPQESHKSFSIVHTIFYILHRLPVYYLFPTLTQKSSKNLNQTETDNQYPSHLSNICSSCTLWEQITLPLCFKGPRKTKKKFQLHLAYFNHF